MIEFYIHLLTFEQYGAINKIEVMEMKRIITYKIAIIICLMALITILLTACRGMLALKQEAMVSEPEASVSNSEVQASDSSEENLYATTLQSLGEQWVRAFCNRDADTLYGLLHDKNLFDEIGGSHRDDGSRRIGISSPWPWYEEEAKVILENDNLDFILLWRTSDQINSQRARLLYVYTENGYQVTGVEYPFIMTSSWAAFIYKYEFGLPPFHEYVPSYQSLADHDPEVFGYLYNPVLAAKDFFLTHLSSRFEENS